MENFDWIQHIKEVLDRTEFMAVSTMANGESWVCPVQFSYDNNFNLYFKSMPQSRHMQSIKENGRVSVAIFSTNRLEDDDVVGVQLKGSARILDTEEEVTKAAKYHYGREDPDYDYHARVAEHMGDGATWKFVKITPDELWYFDTRLFDEEAQGRQLVPKEIYQ